jgi:hypothetical protein
VVTGKVYQVSPTTDVPLLSKGYVRLTTGQIYRITSEVRQLVAPSGGAKNLFTIQLWGLDASFNPLAASYTTASISGYTETPLLVGTADGWVHIGDDFTITDANTAVWAKAYLLMTHLDGSTVQVASLALQNISQAGLASNYSQAAADSAAQALVSQNAAASSASSAQTSATNAQNAYTAANDAKNLAQTYSGQAFTYAGQASASQTTATNAATSATLAAGVASSSSSAASVAAQYTYPKTFEQDSLFFGGENGAVAATNMSFRTVTEGRVGYNTLNSAYGVIGWKSAVQFFSGNTYRVRARVRTTAGLTKGVTLRAAVYDAQTVGNKTTTIDAASQFLTVLNQWTIVTGDIVVTDASSKWIRPEVYLNFTGTGAATHEILSIELLDVTSEAAANNSASAAATSASNAQTYSNAAGSSATSAQNSAISAQSTSNNLIPDSPISLSNFFSLITGNTSPTIGGTLVGSQTTDTSEGLVWASSQLQYIGNRGWLKVGTGKVFSVETRVKYLVESAGGGRTNLYMRYQDGSGNDLGGDLIATRTQLVSDSWQMISATNTSAAIIAGYPTAVYCRAYVSPGRLTDQTNDASSSWLVSYLRFRDATSETAAASSASAAATSASNASTSSTNASNAATSATASANTAQSSYNSAKSVATRLLPSTFDDGVIYFNDGASFTPNSTFYADHPLASLLSSVAVSGAGNVLQLTATNSTAVNLASKQPVALTTGRTYKITTKQRVVAGASQTFQHGVDVYNGSGVLLGNIIDTPTALANDAAWVTKSFVVSNDTIVAAYSTAIYIKPLLILNSPTGSSSVIQQVEKLLIEDVTESTSANNSANAAAGYASSASTSATAAGNSATSALGSATSASSSAGSASTSAGQASTSAANAFTSAGQASTFASQASTSASNAQGSATSASTSAGVATTAATNAGNSASAAGLSATSATSSATNAGNSATSATNSANSAQSSYNSTKAIAIRLGPSTFEEGVTYFNDGANFTPGSASYTDHPSAAAFSTVSVTNMGLVLQLTPTSGTVVNLAAKQPITLVTGRTYQVTTKQRIIAGAAQTFQHGVEVYDSTGTFLANILDTTPALLSDSNWVVRSFAVSTAAIIAAQASATFIRPLVILNSPSGSTSVRQQIASLLFEDITQSLAASNSASAAATSASTASTQATNAGNSASSALTSATNASTSAGAAATSAGAASTSAGSASTSASNASTSASNALGSANSASTSQTAAANSAFAANTTALAVLPERYDGSTTSQFFSNTNTGSPSSISNLASNQTASGYGQVYEAVAAANAVIDFATRGLVVTNSSKIINVELEFQKTANTGSLTSATGMYIGARGLDSSYNAVGSVALSSPVALTGTVQTASQQFSANAATNILAWASGAVWVRPFGRLVVENGITSVTVQFRRLTITDVTSSVSASNSASAAATSASTATTQATNAGNSATSANNSSTSASTSAGNAATSATNASNSAGSALTSAGNANTSASNASTSASNAAGSATSASTSQTAAANSAIAANNTVLVTLPDRYDNTTTSQFFSSSTVGVPSGISNLASNQTAAGYGAVYETTLGANSTFDWAVRGIITPTSTKIINVELEAQKTANIGSLTSASNLSVGVRALDSTYASSGVTLSSTTALSGSVQVISQQFAATLSSGILAWAAGAVYLRPFGRLTTETGITSVTLQFRRLTITDVTASVNALNSAAAAATSASNASTSATAAGVSATSALNSSTNASTQAGLAATSAGQASTSAGSATTSASQASTSASNAAGSATSASTSQTAAANSAIAANQVVLVILPDRYDGSATSQFFSNTTVGSVTSIPNLASNQTVSGFGSVYESVLSSNSTFDFATRGIVTPTSTKIINVELEFQKTANIGSLTASTNMSIGIRALDSSYASLGTVLSTSSTLTGSVQVISQMFAQNAASGILAWTAGGANLRPYAHLVSETGITSVTVQFRRLTITDVTTSVAASNAASAAASSASNAATSATNAGNSASSALTSSTNAATSAGNAATSAGAASTSAGNASTSASQASTSASGALGSANSAATSQTAAANSATNANLTRAALFPDRYDGTTGQYFSNAVTGAPSFVADLASNASASGYGPVYQYSVAPNTSQIMTTRGVLPAVVGKIYQLETEAQIISGTASGSGFSNNLMSLDASYGSISSATVTYQAFNLGKPVQILTNKFSDTAGTGIYAWGAGSVWLRPWMNVSTDASSVNLVVQFRRMTITDVTSAVSASNSASAAAVSASNANTSSNNAGSSATSALNSATNAATSAGAASTSAGQASTSAGNASTSAGQASTSAANALGSANSASTSQTAAANSASAANTTALTLFPDRYDSTTTSQFFSSTTVGSPSSISNLASNQNASGYGSVYEIISGPSVTTDWAIRGVVTTNSTKIINIELEFQKTANSGSLTAATGMFIGVRSLDSSYAALGTTLSTSTALSGAVQISTQMFAQTAGINILAWVGGAVYVRPFGRLVTEAGITSATVQFRRLTISDVTQSVSASNSASAAATSASNASTSSTNAGNSATAANTSAVNAASTYINAVNVSALQFPNDFSLDSTYWTNGPTGKTPTDTTTGTYVNSVDLPTYRFYSPSLNTGISVTRTTTATYIASGGSMNTAAINAYRFEYSGTTPLGGLIEPSVTNMAFRSAEIDNAVWAKTNCTVAANVGTAPDGTSTADRITLSTNTPTVSQTITVAGSTTYTLSFFAKLETLLLSDWKVGILDNTNSSYIVSAQQLASANSSTWTRNSITFTTASNCTSINIIPMRSTAASGSTLTFQLWGVQLEQRSSATSYIATSASTVNRGADQYTLNWSLQGVADGAATIQYVFDDGSTQNVSQTVSGGLTTIPTNLNRLWVRKIYKL